MFLNESEDPNNRKLMKLQKGDKFVLQPPKGEKEYSVVQMVNGNEILFMTTASDGTKTRKGYKIYASDAIEGNVITFFPGTSKTRGKMAFNYIAVADANGNHKFTIQPIDDSEEEENGEELTPEQEEVKEILDNERKEIFSEFSQIEDGNTFTMMFGEIRMENELYTGEIIEKTTSQAHFKVNGVYNGDIVMATLTKVDGAKASAYQPYIDQSISFAVNKSGLFEQTLDGVSIKGYTNDKEEVFFKYVYYFHIDDEEEDGGSIARPRPEFNKDLMRMIHHKTWKDKLLGRDGKGIVPLQNLQQKFLGGEIKDKKYIKFKLDTDVIVGSGNNLRIKKNTEVFGKQYDSGRIIVHGKNGKQSIHLFLKNTSKPNIYTVKIQAVKGPNDKEDMGNAKLTIID